MSIFEKKLKKSLRSSLKHESRLEAIKCEANLVSTPKSPLSNRKAILFPSLGALGLAAITTVCVVGVNTMKKSTVINDPGVKNCLLQINSNPSIILSINQEGMVNSLYGVNNDGKLILNGENYRGQSSWQAIMNILNIEAETGYLVRGLDNEVNSLSFTLYSSDDNAYDNLKDSVVSFLANKSVRIKENNVSITKTNSYSSLSLPITGLGSVSSFETIQKEADKYFLDYGSFATLILDEFNEFVTNYEDKAAYIESAFSVLEKQGYDFSSYSSKVEEFHTGITNYTGLYSKIFVEDECAYSLKFKELYEKKMEILVLREELMAKGSDASKEEELITLTNELDSIIDNLNHFREEMLLSIKGRLDNLASIANEFDSLNEDSSFRKVVTTSEFSKEYTNRKMAYQSSFRNKYSSSFDSWNSYFSNVKETLMEQIKNNQ